MKKIALSFILFASLLGTSFAENFFAHRFFEIKIDIPVNVSNNLVSLTDILQETAVIDLPQIADNVSFKGAAFKAGASPSVGVKLDIPRGLIFGVSAGAQADIGVGLSKDLFEFLGHGNVDMGNEFKMEASNTYADLFATVTVDGGWNTKKARIEFSGTAFSSIVHFDASNTGARIYLNDEENSAGFEAKVDAKAYTIAGVDDLTDIQKLVSSVKGNIGFDVSGSYQRDLSRLLTVGAKVRIPVVPSKMSVGYSVQYDMAKEFNFDSFLGKSDETTETTTQTEVPKEEEEETEDNGFLGAPTILATPYSIHRPMKIGVSADFHPFGSLLTTSGYFGLGFRHPFAAAINKANGSVDETQFYIDYSVAGRLSLWNILSLSLSHSYMDEIFKNEIALALNIRLAEVDAGVSFQSPSFTKSFTGAGVGAFLTVCLGF